MLSISEAGPIVSGAGFAQSNRESAIVRHNSHRARDSFGRGIGHDAVLVVLDEFGRPVSSVDDMLSLWRR